jgi:hypothetical protein
MFMHVCVYLHMCMYMHVVMQIMHTWMCVCMHIYILWRIDLLLGNDSVNIFPREATCGKIGRLLLGNGSVNTPKTIQDNRTRCFPWAPPRGYITRSSKGAVVVRSWESSGEEEFTLVVVENWVEFGRWQSKATEKKWQEMNQAVQRKFHMWFEVTVRPL